MENIFDLQYTYTLLESIKKVQPPVNFLTDLFFNKKTSVNTDYIVFEELKQKRQLANYLSRGSRGLNIERTKSKARMYKMALIGARRTISEEDVRNRLAFEVPNLYTPVTPEERAARLRAQDMADLMLLMENRRGQMSSEILQTGKIKIAAYNNDGVIEENEVLDFGWNGLVTPTVPWNNSAATIYDDLKTVSEKIQEEEGEIPTVAICGKNIERALLNNEEIRQWLLIPNRQNLTMAGFAPKFTSPQVRHIGYISALNLELVSYSQTFTDTDGTVKYYIEPNNVIIGIPNLGRQVYGSVNLFQNGNWHTINGAEIVPFYTADDTSQTTSLTLYSRHIQIPDSITSWHCIKTA